MKKVQLTTQFVQDAKSAQVRRFGSAPPYEAGQIVQASRSSFAEEGARQPGNWFLNLGAYSYSVTGNHTLKKLSVGRFCSLAAGLHVVDGSHPIEWGSTSPFFYSQKHAFAPESVNKNHTKSSYGNTIIGNDVWVGRNCFIKAGTKIGHGAVVAMGSVVVNNVPPYMIVGGNPAKPIRRRFPDEICEELVQLEWWTLPPNELQKMPVHKIEEFLKECRLMNGQKHDYKVVRLP